MTAERVAGGGDLVARGEEVGRAVPVGEQQDAVRASDEAERMLLEPLGLRRQQPFREALRLLATHPDATQG